MLRRMPPTRKRKRQSHRDESALPFKVKQGETRQSLRGARPNRFRSRICSVLLENISIGTGKVARATERSVVEIDERLVPRKRGKTEPGLQVCEFICFTQSFASMV